MSCILRGCPKIKKLHPAPFDNKHKHFGLSLANFHNKLVIVTGGMDIANLFYESKTCALEVLKGNWKAKDTLPSINSPRSYHGSCVIEKTVYLIAGYDTSFKRISSIEMLSMQLHEDLSFANIDKIWSQAFYDNLEPRTSPFVSEVQHNSFLVYGGSEKYLSSISRGIVFKNNKIINFTKEANFLENIIIKRFSFWQNENFSSTSHGVLTRKGIAVGLCLN